MRRFGILLIILATTFPVLAEDWTTADGKTYRNVVVIAQEDDGVRVTYTGGVGKIPYYELSPELQKRFGEDYDSLVAKKAAAEKALAEATQKAEAAAEQKKQQDAAAAAAALQQHNNPQPAATAQTQPPPSSPPQGHIIQLEPGPASAPAPEAPPPTLVESDNLYPGSNLSYDDNLDECFMDSPAVGVVLVVLEAAPGAPASLGSGATLTFRIVTEARRPETPDRVEGTFFSGTGEVNKLVGTPQVNFIVDGVSVPAHDLADAGGEFDGATVSGPNRVSFFITVDQLKSIFGGNKVNFSVGANDYRIDPAGIAIFRKYLVDVDQLPPASTNFVRAYHRFLDRLPSIVTVISTVCTYIILGGFVLVMAASVAAFVMGMSRFLNM